MKLFAKRYKENIMSYPGMNPYRRIKKNRSGKPLEPGFRKRIADRNARKVLERRRKKIALSDMNKSKFLDIINESAFLGTFSEQLKEHMKRACVTVEWLSEATGLNEKTIQRLRNANIEHMKLKYVIAVCIALELSYPDSLKLISSAGYVLRKDVEIERIYDYLISHIDEISNNTDIPLVVVCNQKLVEFGYDPLSELKE
jgi:ribosomal protein L34/DNA-binding Xre family transcriptional regulator